MTKETKDKVRHIKQDEYLKLTEKFFLSYVLETVGQIADDVGFDSDGNINMEKAAKDHGISLQIVQEIQEYHADFHRKVFLPFIDQYNQTAKEIGREENFAFTAYDVSCMINYLVSAYMPNLGRNLEEREDLDKITLSDVLHPVFTQLTMVTAQIVDSKKHQAVADALDALINSTDQVKLSENNQQRNALYEKSYYEAHGGMEH